MVKNCFKTLPKALGEMENLEGQTDACWNRIKFFDSTSDGKMTPDFLFPSNRLDNLTYPPANVCERGPAAIKAYFIEHPEPE